MCCVSLKDLRQKLTHVPAPSCLNCYEFQLNMALIVLFDTRDHQESSVTHNTNRRYMYMG